MSSLDATPYPIDMAALERGSVIPPDDIEGAYGVNRTHRDYGMSMLRMRTEVYQYFMRERADCVTICNQGDALRLLTHQEQAEYVPRAQARAIRSFAKRHREDLAIDEEQLTPEERERRRVRLLKSSWLLQQSRKKPPKLPEAKQAVERQGEPGRGEASPGLERLG